MSVIGGASQGGAVDTGDIGHSLRFRASNGSQVSRAYTGSTTQKKITFSFWLKRGVLGTNQCIFAGGYVGSGGGGVAGDYFRFNTSNQLEFIYDDSINAIGPYPTGVFRDPTAWLHFVIAFDTTQAVQADRCKVWVNNVQQTISNGLALNADLYFMYGLSGANARWGARDRGGPDQFFDGYMARCCAVLDQALTPSSFGYQNTESNAWVTKSQAAVKAVVDTGGAKSHMLDFDDGTSLTTLGYDKSSKGNNWTLNNFSLTPGVTYDWMTDTPSNDFCVINPLVLAADCTFSDGNLKFAYGPSNNIIPCFASFGMSSGEWYWTSTITANSSGSTSALTLGLSQMLSGLINYPGFNTTLGWGYYGDSGAVYNNGSTVASGASFGVGDVLGFKFNADAGTLQFYKQASGSGSFALQATINSIPVGTYYPCFGDGSAARTGAAAVNFGQQPINNTAWVGTAKALCTANLPDGETITTSGSFTGNASADGPYIDLKGVPSAMTINGNAVTFGTHADKTAFGFKVRNATASYNAAGTNTYSITSTGAKRKYSNGQGNP